LHLKTPSLRLISTEARISSFLKAKSIILNPSLGPLAFISGVIIPETFLSEI
jgi:hypothetical protein